MASSNVASSAVSYTPGNMMVVTHVIPVAPNEEQQTLLNRRHKFRKVHPKALGTVQIMIGVLTLLFGIAAAVDQPSLGVSSGIFIWGSLIYIISGSLTVAAEKYLSYCLIIASLVLNIVAAVIATAGVVLFALDPVVLCFHYCGYSIVVAVFQFLELIVSITMAAYACTATCSYCCTEPQVFIQAAEGPTQAPPHFQEASVAPAEPYPQVMPNFKDPGDLGSAEPPAYQPN
uniref:Membrane-spanning 4-domains subfamily A member 15-like n=1 Tax=Salarias fasciatus TaxID=181472 RepID=A0A672HM06_SALFA